FRSLERLDPGVARELSEHRHLLRHEPQRVARLELLDAQMAVERLVEHSVKARLERALCDGGVESAARVDDRALDLRAHHLQVELLPLQEPVRPLTRLVDLFLAVDVFERLQALGRALDRKSTRLNSSHVKISYAVFCLK